MKRIIKYISFISLLSFSNLASAADVEYSVVAFPRDQQTVAVVIGGQAHTLSASADYPNIYKGVAPSAGQYQYALLGGAGDVLETNLRSQQAGITATGNEFFNRTQTVYNVPSLPQAYNPIYHPLMSNMNRSNEIATVILQVNATGFNQILTNPLLDLDYTEVYNMTFISNQETFKFINAGIKNSGKSTKEFAKQSYKIKLNEFTKTGPKELLYGRTTIKLRAHETDPTFVREKLVADMLAAAGGATVQGQFARLYVNNEPFGLYLMIDDSTSNFIDNVLHGGNLKYQYTGPTYKGNALNPAVEGNLVYKDDLQQSYNDTMYELEDEGNMKELKNNDTISKTPLIEFIKQLNAINPALATDANNKGDLEKLLNTQHTLVHMAMNFLSGSWDGFWYQASNYYLNKDTSSNQWALISYDFDETLGLGAPSHFATTPYSNFSRPDSQRPLIDVFLKSPYYKAEFDTVLTTIVKRFFKPSVIQPRLEVWAKMLYEDVEWDLSLEPKSPGIRPQWTSWNFLNNLNTTDGLSMGVAEWVRVRSTALQQQLQITDVDDLPPLGPYVTSNVWDPVNYEKEDIKSKDETKKGDAASSAGSRSIVSMTAVVVLACITTQFLFY